jgi:predicted nucleotidyltransferase
MFDLSPDHLELVNSILVKYVPNVEVRAFGSRVEGTARDYSDLDLVIVGQTKIDRQTLYRLEEAFAESDLPFRVDVLDRHRISDSFRQVIEEKYVVLQP